MCSYSTLGRNNIVAELLGVQCALDRALMHDWSNVIVECDCKPVVGWMRGTDLLGAEHGYLKPLVVHCRGLLFELQRKAKVQIRWISRNRNTVADALAKQAARGYALHWVAVSEAVAMLSVKPWLREVLQKCGVEIQDLT